MSEEAGKYKAPPTLCKCGHPRESHYNGRGRCFRESVLGGHAGGCDCSRYHAANKAIPLSPSLKLATGKGLNSEGARWVRAAKRNRDVANLPPPPATLRTEAQGLAFLKEHHPEFFADETSLAIAAAIIKRMPEEMARFKPVQRAGVIAGIMALMYDMGSAALAAIHRPKGVGMAKVFVEREAAR